MKIFRIVIFYPFSILYGIILSIRNFLFNKGLLKSCSFPLPVIGIGNLSAGGTGKTPMTEYLAALLAQNGEHVAILSRGYGRKTRGFIEADKNSDARQIGDEPWQLYRKFPGLKIFVCEKRKTGIEKIMASYPSVSVILLDDAYQHRQVKPGLNILLTAFDQPFFRDFVIPSGYLREFRSGKKRADIMVVTKCPVDLNENVKNDFKLKIKPFPQQNLLFSHLTYGSLISATGNKSIRANEYIKYSALIFTGIGSAAVLKSQAQKWFRELIFLNFADHHDFNLHDFNRIKNEFDRIAAAEKILITTEKDIRRIEKSSLEELFNEYEIYYLPVAIDFNVAEKDLFENKILNYVRKNQGNR